MRLRLAPESYNWPKDQLWSSLFSAVRAEMVRSGLRGFEGVKIEHREHRERAGHGEFGLGRQEEWLRYLWPSWLRESAANCCGNQRIVVAWVCRKRPVARR
jgi:hypothetical protein